MVILNKSANGAHDVLQLRDSMLQARRIAEQLQRQVNSSTDEQIQELHGIPANHMAAYKTVLTNVLTSLQSEPVEILLGNVA
jgi:hypothetical protein